MSDNIHEGHTCKPRYLYFFKTENKGQYHLLCQPVNGFTWILVSNTIYYKLDCKTALLWFAILASIFKI